MFDEYIFGESSSSDSSSSDIDDAITCVDVIREILMDFTDSDEDEEWMNEIRLMDDLEESAMREFILKSDSSMAPKKRSIADDQETVKPPTPTATTTSVRVTRCSNRQVDGNSVADSVEPRKNKKAKPTPKEEEVESDFKGDAETGAESNTVVIEHCKQCNSFKTRAVLVKNGLENGVPGITVLVNPDKPRKGCFEIRKEDGETFISLLDMKRPFLAMKALDMNQVIADIIDKIK